MTNIYQKNKKYFHISGFFIVFVFVSILSLNFFNKTDAQIIITKPSSHNVSGFVWSSNIGWISLNREDCDSNNDGNFGDPKAGVQECPTAGPVYDYGVSISPITGAFSGFAWSQVGWIRFNTSACGASPSVNLVLKPGTSGYRTTGFIKALAGGTPGSGGWDGCIALSDTLNFTSPDISGGGGVTYLAPTGLSTKGKLIGYAWGSEVIGWVNFNYVNVDLSKPFIDLQVTDQNNTVKNPIIAYTALPNFPIKPTLHFSSANVVAPCTTTSSSNDNKWKGILPNTLGKLSVSDIAAIGSYSYTLNCVGNDGKTYSSTASINIVSSNIPSVVLEVGPFGTNSKLNTWQAKPTGTFIPQVYWKLTDIKVGSCNTTTSPTSAPADTIWDNTTIFGTTGSKRVSTINSSQMNNQHTFYTECTGIDGNPYFDTATIDFGLVPDVSIFANGNGGYIKIDSGKPVTINWTKSSNVTSCEIGTGNDGMWSKDVLNNIPNVDSNSFTTPIDLSKSSFVWPSITANTTTYVIMCKDMNNQFVADFVNIDTNPAGVWCPSSNSYLPTGTICLSCPSGFILMNGICQNVLDVEICGKGVLPLADGTCPPGGTGGIKPKFEEF